MPQTLSEYTARVLDFQDADVSRGPDGSFIFDGVGAVRTLRLAASLGWPDLARSQGVVGVRDLPHGRYVALDGSAHVALYLQPDPPQGPYLVSSNGRVVAWQWRSGKGGRRVAVARLAGHVPLVMTVGGCPQGATLLGPGTQATSVKAPAGEATWLFKSNDSRELTLACR
jgi:hypothetical protein